MCRGSRVPFGQPVAIPPGVGGGVLHQTVLALGPGRTYGRQELPELPGVCCFRIRPLSLPVVVGQATSPVAIPQGSRRSLSTVALPVAAELLLRPGREATAKPSPLPPFCVLHSVFPFPCSAVCLPPSGRSAAFHLRRCSRSALGVPTGARDPPKLQ